MKTLNRSIMPPFSAIDEINIIRAGKQKLDNGIPVYILNAGDQDVVRTDFIFPAGLWSQPAPLVSSTVSAMLTEGTKKRTSAQIAEELDYYGSFLNTDCNEDSVTLSLYSLNKHLSRTLPIVQDILKNSIFPEKELSVYLQKAKEKFILKSNKVKVMAHRKFSEAVFGPDHPYGNVTQLDDFDKINQRQLLSFFKRLYNNKNCQMIISGKINKHILPLLNRHFGEESRSPETKIIFSKHRIIPSKKKKFIVEKEDAVQCAVRIGKPIVGKTHPDYMGLKVLNTVLGGYFGSRLMSNIREDKGYTYGIGSAVKAYKKASVFFISTEVGSAVCSDAVKEIYYEVEKLQVNPVPLDELQRVKNYMMGDILRSFDGPFAMADSFRSILDFNLSYNYFDRLIHTIRTITPAELKKLAKTYLKKEDMYEIIAGKNT